MPRKYYYYTLNEAELVNDSVANVLDFYGMGDRKFVLEYNNVKRKHIKCFTKASASDKIEVKEGSVIMAQAMVNFRMDEELKKSMEETCKELGLSMTTAFTIFAKKMTREKRIPFDVSVDPFYSESNMAYLKKVVDDIEKGKAVLTEHELIEG